jgi:hypothetical protein
MLEAPDPRPVVWIVTTADAVIGYRPIPAGTRVQVDTSTAQALASAGVAIYLPLVRVRLLQGDLVGGVWHEAGSVVEVEDDQAGMLVGSRRGELLDGEALGPAGNAKLVEWYQRSAAPAPGRSSSARPYIADDSTPVRIRTCRPDVMIGAATWPVGSVAEVHPHVAARLVGHALAVLEPGYSLREARNVVGELQARGDWHPVQP